MPVIGRLKDGNLLLPGEINERMPIVNDGLFVHYPFDGTTTGFTYKKSLIDNSYWKVGTSGSQGIFTQNGDGNRIIMYANPWGYDEPTWASIDNDVTSDADGGWNVSGQSIDRTKKYRLSVWVRREDAGNGSFYFGCQANTVFNLGTTTKNSNPYFYSGNPTQIRENWVLFVAYIHPDGYAGGDDSTNGAYSLNGNRLFGVRDFKWASDATFGGHRTYLYYSTVTTERQYWIRPRMEICDGTEAPISDLLGDRDNFTYPIINTNTVLSDDGISIEESTTNLVKIDQQDISNWVKANHTDTGKTTLDPLGNTVKIWSVLDEGYTYTDTASVVLGSIYTGSVYVKPNKDYTFRLRLGNDISDNVSVFAPANVWTRLVNTKAMNNSRMLIGYRDTDIAKNVPIGFEVAYSMPQIELRPFITTFTTGTRNKSVFKIKMLPEHVEEGSMVWRVKLPLRTSGARSLGFQWSPTGASSGHFGVKYDATNRKFIAQYSTTTSSASYELDDKEHTVIWNYKNGISQQLYVDGEKILDVACTSMDDTNRRDGVYPIGHTGWSYDHEQWNGEIYSYSLYNRKLTDNEVNKLSKQSFSITKDGNMMAKKIIEKPNGIPNDAVYISLGFNSEDNTGQVRSSTETNAKYQDGAIWVGKGHTNIFTSLSDGTFPITSGKDFQVLVNSSDEVVYRNNFTSELLNYKGRDITVTAGTTYTVSLEIFVSSDFNGNYTKMANVEQAGAVSFDYDMSRKGTWQKFKHIFTPSANGNSRFLMYPSQDNSSSSRGYVLYRNPQFVALPYQPAYHNGVLGYSRLSYDGVDLTNNNYQEFTYIITVKYSQANEWRLSGAWSRWYFGANTNNGLTFSWVDGTQRSTVSSSGIIPINEWVTIGVTVKNNVAIDIYLNGERVGGHGIGFNLSSTSMNFELNGINPGNTSYPLNAWVKDMIFSNRAFTASEMKTIASTYASSYQKHFQIKNNLNENQVF